MLLGQQLRQAHQDTTSEKHGSRHSTEKTHAQTCEAFQLYWMPLLLLQVQRDLTNLQDQACSGPEGATSFHSNV